MERDLKGLCTVLSSERKGERDRELTLISSDRGVIRARVYGAQKSAKSIKAPLFSDGVFSLYRAGENRISVRDVDIISLRDSILEDIDRATSANLFAELAIKSRVYDENLYMLLTRSLDALALDLGYKRTVIAFVVKFLSMYGTFGDYEHCPVCQRVYSPDEILGYNNRIGASCCQECSTGEEGLILPPKARVFIRECIRRDFSDIFTFSVSEAQEDRIFRFLLRLLLSSFPARIESLSCGIWTLI